MILFIADSGKTTETDFLKQVSSSGCGQNRLLLVFQLEFRVSVLTHNVSNNLLERFCLSHAPEPFYLKTSVLNEKCMVRFSLQAFWGFGYLILLGWEFYTVLTVHFSQ